LHQAEHNQYSDNATGCKTEGPWVDSQKRQECFLVHETWQQDNLRTQRTAEWVLGINVWGWKLTENCGEGNDRKGVGMETDRKVWEWKLTEICGDGN